MRIRAITAAMAAVFLLAGCATVPGGKADPRDPFERANRSIYSFNNGLDHAIIRPTARAWRTVMPKVVRKGLSNFVTNLAYPTTIVNDFLQGKFSQGGRDFTRLLINSVFGLGFFDPASRDGLERHDEDFGQTLGKWGVHAGPYIMLPIFGPSSVRDAPSRLVDDYTDIRHYFPNQYVRWGLWGVDKIEVRASLLDLDAALDRSFDPYALIRNAWIQRREYLVRDGDMGDESVEPEPDPEPDPAADTPPK